MGLGAPKQHQSVTLWFLISGTGYVVGRVPQLLPKLAVLSLLRTMIQWASLRGILANVVPR